MEKVVCFIISISEHISFESTSQTARLQRTWYALCNVYQFLSQIRQHSWNRRALVEALDVGVVLSRLYVMHKTVHLDHSKWSPTLNRTIFTDPRSPAHALSHRWTGGCPPNLFVPSPLKKENPLLPKIVDGYEPGSVGLASLDPELRCFRSIARTPGLSTLGLPDSRTAIYYQ